MKRVGAWAHSNFEKIFFREDRVIVLVGDFRDQALEGYFLVLLDLPELEGLLAIFGGSPLLNRYTSLNFLTMLLDLHGTDS